MSCSPDFLTEIDRAARCVAPETLELMFFATAAQTCERRLAEHWNILVPFRGEPPGLFEMRIERDLARELAAAFLGLENRAEVADAYAQQVACELANIICGSILSRAESETGFALGSPEQVPETDCIADADYRSAFMAESGGVLEIAFRMDDTVC